VKSVELIPRLIVGDGRQQNHISRRGHYLHKSTNRAWQSQVAVSVWLRSREARATMRVRRGSEWFPHLDIYTDKIFMLHSAS